MSKSGNPLRSALRFCDQRRAIMIGARFPRWRKLVTGQLLRGATIELCSRRDRTAGPDGSINSTAVPMAVWRPVCRKRMPC